MSTHLSTLQKAKHNNKSSVPLFFQRIITNFAHLK